MKCNKDTATFRRHATCAAAFFIVTAAGCVGETTETEGVGASAAALANRAYVVSKGSDDLFVVDLRDMSEVGKIDIGKGGGIGASHMSVLSQEGEKLYVMQANHNDITVVDTTALEVTRRIAVGNRPTHASPCYSCPPFDQDELWVVNEQDGSVSVIDMATDDVVETIEHESMVAPHFVRFANGSAYVPSIGGNQITAIDLESREVSDVILLDEKGEPGACAGDPCGFADAQIDESGLLVSAHIETGNVLVYDTKSRTRLADIPSGKQPWAVFVDPLNDAADTHLMPNWADSTVSILDRVQLTEIARSSHGDQESYGVNYSPLVPDEAFVLNRVKESVSVIHRTTGDLIETIDVGGTTETGATTPDGRYLLLPLSSTNEFAVIDVETREEAARFDDVGLYPWSVTTLGGQSYCH